MVFRVVSAEDGVVVVVVLGSVVKVVSVSAVSVVESITVSLVDFFEVYVVSGRGSVPGEAWVEFGVSFAVGFPHGDEEVLDLLSDLFAIPFEGDSLGWWEVVLGSFFGRDVDFFIGFDIVLGDGAVLQVFFKFVIVFFSLFISAAVVVVIEVRWDPRAFDVSILGVFRFFELKDERLPEVGFGYGSAGYLRERFVVFVEYRVNSVDD